MSEDVQEKRNSIQLMRKLATVRQITEIRPIANADLLELAIIDGWQAVIKKSEFKAGDRCIYCEIDSFLPIKPEYEFLRKSCYRRLADGTEGFRIKTVKLRGQLSQGLVLPLSDDSWQLGDDVTEALGISKYAPTVGRSAIGLDIKGGFPGFIPKTDEERIQNLTSELPELCQRRYTITEKLDGSSFTCYNHEDVFGVCSRNYERADVFGVCSRNYERADVLGAAYWAIAKEYNLEEKLKGSNIAIQGEVVGAGIQGNKYKLGKKELYVFNIFDINAQQYFPQFQAQAIAASLGLKFVPVLEQDFTLPPTVEEILKLAEGKSLLESSAEREGLVFVSDDGDRLSFKAISNKFLLKEG